MLVQFLRVGTTLGLDAPRSSPNSDLGSPRPGNYLEGPEVAQQKQKYNPLSILISLWLQFQDPARSQSPHLPIFGRWQQCKYRYRHKFTKTYRHHRWWRLWPSCGKGIQCTRTWRSHLWTVTIDGWCMAHQSIIPRYRDAKSQRSLQIYWCGISGRMSWMAKWARCTCKYDVCILYMCAADE